MEEKDDALIGQTAEEAGRPVAHWKELTAALRVRAREMRKKNEDKGDAEVEDNALLLSVLAKLVEGCTVYQSFGAPGDWGYGTPIGDALQVCYRRPGTR